MDVHELGSEVSYCQCYGRKQTQESKCKMINPFVFHIAKKEKNPQNEKDWTAPGKNISKTFMES